MINPSWLLYISYVHVILVPSHMITLCVHTVSITVYILSFTFTLYIVPRHRFLEPIELGPVLFGMTTSVFLLKAMTGFHFFWTSTKFFVLTPGILEIILVCLSFDLALAWLYKFRKSPQLLKGAMWVWPKKQQTQNTHTSGARLNDWAMWSTQN